MKWPVTGLEARLRASFSRLFRSRQPGRRKDSTSKTSNTMPKSSLSPDSHDLAPSPDSQRWTDSSRSAVNRSDYRSASTRRSKKRDSPKQNNHYRKNTARKSTSTNLKQFPKALLKSDASVNTDLSYSIKDAYSQVDLIGKHINWSTNTQTKAPDAQVVHDTCPKLISNLSDQVSYFDNTPILSANAVQHVRVLGRDLIPGGSMSESTHSVQPTSHYCSDPFLFDTMRSGNLGLIPVRPENFYAGASRVRQINSSTGCITCLGETSSYPGNLGGLRLNRSLDDSEYHQPIFKSSHASIPRNHWFSPQSPIQLSISSPMIPQQWESPSQHPRHPRNDDEEMLQSSSIVQIPVTHVEGTFTNLKEPERVQDVLSAGKPTKECGDEDRRQNVKNNKPCKLLQTAQRGQNSTVRNIATSTHGMDSSTSSGSKRLLTFSTSSRGRRRGFSYHTRVDHVTHLHRDQASETNPISTDSLGDRQASGRASFSKNRRTDLSQRSHSVRKDSRPHIGVNQRPVETRHSEDHQMIHHNCTLIPKDVHSQRSEKSDRSLRKYALYPQSTSDDGDASKYAAIHIERSTDYSSSSSIHIKPAQVDKCNSEPPVLPQVPLKSPTQVTRTSKLGGALPEFRDLQQCPTGRHLDAKPDKPCICIMVKRMVLAQSTPVLYTWHSQAEVETEPTKNVSRAPEPNDPSLSQVKKSSSDVEVAPKSMDGKSSLAYPTLPNFQLARPTRMVRGGQGTVAWVSNAATGHFYALKFKHRDNRSDSTWAIERREAKLMRNSQHDFIVRLYHIYETEETLFMALEWLDGGCLWNHVARTGTLPECYVIYYAACILSALRYLHSQFIVYRDMKAENVVLDKRGRPKLIDFGMAKRFADPCKKRESQTDKTEESANDSDDFEQPPTRYYFAAYLAPEIYDHSASDCHFIDSWGLGYILVEMLLGYGIFLPMPWENDPGMHLNANWKLTLPNDSTCRLSPVCDDFIRKMLLRRPQDRMELAQAEKHVFFSRVSWSNLSSIRGPDLSKCPSRITTSNGTSSTQTGNGGARRWVSRYNSTLHVPDLAFVKEFVGTLAPNLVYTTHAFGLGNRRVKAAKPNHTRAATTGTYDSRSHTESTGRGRSSAVGGAIEIRGAPASQTGEMKQRDVNKSQRGNRRSGVQAAT